VCVYIYIYIYIYIYGDMENLVHARDKALVDTLMRCEKLQVGFAGVYVCTYIHTYTHEHIHTHTHMNTYIHTYAHTKQSYVTHSNHPAPTHHLAHKETLPSCTQH
jgi:hypothetical protein